MQCIFLSYSSKVGVKNRVSICIAIRYMATITPTCNVILPNTIINTIMFCRHLHMTAHKLNVSNNETSKKFISLVRCFVLWETFHDPIFSNTEWIKSWIRILSVLVLNFKTCVLPFTFRRNFLLSLDIWKS